MHLDISGQGGGNANGPAAAVYISSAADAGLYYESYALNPSTQPIARTFLLPPGLYNFRLAVPFDSCNDRSADCRAFGHAEFSVQFRRTNDSCADAIDLSAGVTFVGSLVGATNDGASGCGDSGSNPDVWYRFTAPGSCCCGMLMVDTCGSQAAFGSDTVLTLFSDCGGTQITCNDDASSGGFRSCNDPPYRLDSNVAVRLEPGQTVYIRVAEFGAHVQTGFYLNVSYGYPNETCAHPTKIFADSYDFTTCFSSTDGPTESNCYYYSTLHGYNDLWWSYTAPVDGTVVVSTAGSNYDTQLFAYGGGCPTGNNSALTCNDDANGTLQSQIEFAALAGQTYLIRVGSYTFVDFGSGVLTLGFFCHGDFNHDTGIDFFDYLDFVDAFSSNAASADFNHDGAIDFFDYLDFVDAFTVGC